MTSVKLQISDSRLVHSFQSPSDKTTNTDMEIIDLDTTNTSSTSSSSTTTTFNEDVVVSDDDVVVSDSSEDIYHASNQRISKKDREHRKHLMEMALENIKNIPCMTTQERVLKWKISDNLAEVEEFSSCDEKLVYCFWFFFYKYILKDVIFFRHTVNFWDN